jgi:cupin 2 domain-containing protein
LGHSYNQTMNTKNIFKIAELPTADGNEIFELLCKSENLKIKRIISTGQVTPDGEWYDQQENEWVILLQGTAKLEFKDGRLEKLIAGDYLYLPSGTKHRVSFTSQAPPCIWLAVYFE